MITVLNNRAVSASEREEHKQKLAYIRSKITGSFTKVSGRTDINEQYDVITVNAGRAWTGIGNNNHALVKAGSIQKLRDRL